MKVLGIVLLLGLVAAGVVWVGTKFFNLAKDEDKDGIPDKVENAVEDVKATAKEVKRRAKRVKEEVQDVVDEIKEAADQVKDIADAAKGKPRRGRPSKN